MVIILKIELKNTIKTIFISLNPYTNEKKDYSWGNKYLTTK